MSAVENRADRMAQVRAQVTYHHQRLVLHQRLHGSSPSTRLADLEHAYSSARERLAVATEDTRTAARSRDRSASGTAYDPTKPLTVDEEKRRAPVRPPLESVRWR